MRYAHTRMLISTLSIVILSFIFSSSSLLHAHRKLTYREMRLRNIQRLEEQRRRKQEQQKQEEMVHRSPAPEPEHDILSKKEDALIELMQVAETYSKIMDKLLRANASDLSHYSLTELNKAIECLEAEHEMLSACPKNDVRYAEINGKYLPLLFELMRKLKTARFQYRQKTGKTGSAWKKSWIPTGVTVAVGAGLLALNYGTGMEIGIGTILKLSALAGTITGVIVYKDELIGVMHKGGKFVLCAAHKLGGILGAKSGALKIGSGVAGLLAAGAVMYTQKSDIARFLGISQGESKQPLSSLSHAE